MKSEDASITVTKVQKDADGSYDVFGTRNCSQVTYDVSADLKTFIERAARSGSPDSTASSSPTS